MCDNVVFVHQTDGFNGGQDLFMADIEGYVKNNNLKKLFWHTANIQDKNVLYV